jgi:carbonic anhydrase
MTKSTTKRESGMKRGSGLRAISAALLMGLAAISWADSAHQAHGAGGHAAIHRSELAQVEGVVSTILTANQKYARSHRPEYFAHFANKQTPRATVITCSDSRVQTEALHKEAVNDLFVVRDIGNQLATAEGSIEYGVRHLHTPLLMVIGHSVCGAISAASSDYSKLEPAIQKELVTINIPKGIDVTDGVLLNVNNQVEAAMLKFSGEVESGKLAVIGAFYDFRNDLGQGAGKLIITNISGESDPAKIARMVKQRQFFKYAFMSGVKQ